MLALTCLFLSASAGEIRFRVETADGIRSVLAEETQRDGVAYISLTSLLAQAGGTCRLAPSRAEVEFGGRAAWIDINGVTVDASTVQFDVTEPVLREGSQVLMAAEDVSPFFAQAFRRSVEGPLPQEGPAGEPEPDAEDILVEMEALEPEATPGSSITLDAAAPDQRTTTLRTIIIDAGHGGADAGAVGYGGVQEKDVTLGIATELKRLLEARLNSKVLLTRSEDVDLPVKARSRFATLSEGDLFVSIHCGASYARAAEGFEVFYDGSPGEMGKARLLTAQCRGLADTIAATLSQATGANSRGQRQAPVRVLKGTGIAGVLVEAGCLTNESEEALLATEAYRAKIAEGIAAGIQAYAGQRTAEAVQ